MFELVTRMHFGSQAEAQDAFNQMEQRAVHASVRTSPGAESLSYSRLKDDTTGAVIDEWHTDIFGIVREGPEQEPLYDAPVWIQPIGATDSYPATDVFGNQTRVVHSGKYWINTHGDDNSWEPGGDGISASIWQEDGEVTP